MTSTAEELRAQYRDLVLAWAAAGADPKKANKVFTKHHAFYKKVRETAEGREAILGLLDDPQTAVRLMAAAHSLRWEPERAEAALEAIEREMSLHGVTAKYTLQEHRRGRLNLDW
jgi:hypothetical protein